MIQTATLLAALLVVAVITACRGFVTRARRLGIKTVLTPIRAPQSNAVAERWVGTLRLECRDHMIPLSERHRRRVVVESVADDNTTRPH